MHINRPLIRANGIIAVGQAAPAAQCIRVVPPQHLCSFSQYILKQPHRFLISSGGVVGVGYAAAAPQRVRVIGAQLPHQYIKDLVVFVPR